MIDKTFLFEKYIKNGNIKKVEEFLNEILAHSRLL